MSMELIQTVNDFDNLLIQVTEETFKYCLGDSNAVIIWNYLEKQNCSLTEMPKNLEVFSEELRNIMGFGRGQILGAASILEGTIFEILCKRIEVKSEHEIPINFPIQVRKLRNQYKGEETIT